MFKVFSKIFTPNAASIVVSALISGSLTAIAVVITDAEKIIRIDALGGLLVTVFVIALKAIQKAIANYNDDRRIAKIIALTDGLPINQQKS